MRGFGGSQGVFASHFWSAIVWCRQPVPQLPFGGRVCWWADAMARNTFWILNYPGFHRACSRRLRTQTRPHRTLWPLMALYPRRSTHGCEWNDPRSKSTAPSRTCWSSYWTCIRSPVSGIAESRGASILILVSRSNAVCIDNSHCRRNVLCIWFWAWCQAEGISHSQYRGSLWRFRI